MRVICPVIPRRTVASACRNSWPKTFSNRSRSVRQSRSRIRFLGEASASGLAENSPRRHFELSSDGNMIIITQPNATEEQINRIVTRVREIGLDAQISRGASRVIIGVIGPEALLREKPLAAMAGVEAIFPALKPYKLAARHSRAPCAVTLGCQREGGGE